MAKGSSYERELCRALTDWWSEGQAKDVLFWRTAGSGGRATMRSRSGKETQYHCGDISALGREGEPLIQLITLEAKRGYSSKSIADLLDKSEHAAQQAFEEWWQQATESAEQARTPYWAIIAKRDKREPVIFIPHSLIIALRKFKCFEKHPQPYLTLSTTVNCKDKFRKWTIPTQRIVGMTLKDFFSGVKPIAIKRLWASLL